MASKDAHKHTWKFKRHKNGAITRMCRCGLKITEIAVPKGSSLDGDYKVIRPKGKHRAKDSDEI